MGVHGLWRLLDTFGEVTRPEDWRGRRVAIDASIWITQFRAQCGAGESVEQRILEGFLLRILKLIFYGIEPVFVFDGASNVSKAQEYHRRAERRAAMERAAISRRAQQIISAQLAAGVLNVEALKQRSPAKTKIHPLTQIRRMKNQNVKQNIPISSLNIMNNDSCDDDVVVENNNNNNNNNNCKENICCDNLLHFDTNDAALRVAKRKRRRSIFVEPDTVSKAVTSAFLTEAEEWIEQKKRGELCLESNALLYSSTSLFMGPRRVLEDTTGMSVTNEKLPSISGENNKVIPKFFSIESSDNTSSVIIDDDDDEEKNSIDNYETVSSGSYSNSSNSVMVVDNSEETFVSHLRNMEELDSNSSNDTFGYSWRETNREVIHNNNDSSYNEDEDEDDDDDDDDDRSNTSISSSNINSRSSSTSEQAYLWNPGTQLINCVRDEIIKDTESKYYKEDNELFTPVLLRNNDKKDKEENNSSVMTTDTPSVTQSTNLGIQYSISRQSKMKQIAPFDLLGILELLDCCGIPFVLSPHEADAQCAFLNQHHLVDAVFTEDSDVIVHGAQVVLRGFFAKGRQVVAYHQSELEACGIDKEVLVALALLLGCDYAEGVTGLSLLEALHVLAAVWHRGNNNNNKVPLKGPSRVFEILTEWGAAVRGGCVAWDDASTLLQYCMNRAKWSTLQVPADFPQLHAIEAFFNASVDADITPFAAASPDWRRLRAFAGVHGLLESNMCRQRLDLAQKEFTIRQSQENNGIDHQQLKLTDFTVKLQKNEKCVYKKQPPKFAEALSALRAVKQV